MTDEGKKVHLDLSEYQAASLFWALRLALNLGKNFPQFDRVLGALESIVSQLAQATLKDL